MICGCLEKNQWHWFSPQLVTEKDIYIYIYILSSEFYTNISKEVLCFQCCILNGKKLFKNHQFLKINFY